MNTYYVHSNGEEFASNVGDLGSILNLPSGRFPWRRECLPTPGFLPREFHGQRSQVGYGPWGHKELDTTEATGHARTPINESRARALAQYLTKQ